MKHTLLIYITIFFALIGKNVAQPNNAPVKLKQLTIEEYVLRYSGIAKEEMRRTGIPASIKLAQGILESNFGNSPLATEANNHFGIKCHTGYQGKGFYMTDDAENECFRIYDRPEDSYFDHSEFLRLRPRYADLFKIDPKDYKSWARGLQQAGYATNPQYANLIIRLIEERNLHQYDTADPELAKSLKTEEDVIKTFENKLVIFNDIKTVIAQPKQTFNDIAKKFEVSYKNLKKYNEFQDDDTNYYLIPGSKVFLEYKKTKGMGIKHKVLENETMYSISQKEGIKLAKLYEYNLMKPGEEPAIGEDLFLRNKSPKMPKLKTQKETDKLYEKLKKITAKNKEELPVKEVKNDTINSNIAQKDTTTKATEISNLKIEKEPQIDAIRSNQEVPIFHVVEPKQTLYTISLMYNIKSQKLIDMNNLNSNALEVGQKLIIGYANDKIKTAEDLKVKKTEREPIKHVVKPRETIYSIAEWYKVKPDDIKRWNNLPDFLLKDSMELIVGYTMPAKTEVVENKNVINNNTAKSNNATTTILAQNTDTKDTLNVAIEAKKQDIFPQYYIVQNETETVDSIAKQFKLPIGLLQKMNNTTAKQFQKGKKVIIGYEKIETKQDTISQQVVAKQISNNEGTTIIKKEMPTETLPVGENIINTTEKIQPDNIVENVISETVSKPVETKPVNENNTLHVVQKGETLYAISRKYNVPVEMLIKLNKMSSTGINEGQKIIISENKNELVVSENIIPINTTLPIKEAKQDVIIKAPDNIEQYHTVQKGETLYAISRLYKVPVESLIKINKLASTSINEGQKMVIRSEQIANKKDNTRVYEPVKQEVKNIQEPKTNNTTVSANANEDVVSPVIIDGIKYHTVQPGETLYRLSVMYKVKVEQLQQWNNMRDFTVKAGQQYIVGK